MPQFGVPSSPQLLGHQPLSKADTAWCPARNTCLIFEHILCMVKKDGHTPQKMPIIYVDYMYGCSCNVIYAAHLMEILSYIIIYRCDVLIFGWITTTSPEAQRKGWLAEENTFPNDLISGSERSCWTMWYIGLERLWWYNMANEDRSVEQGIASTTPERWTLIQMDNSTLYGIPLYDP